ncbi:MAG: hypothetical protein N4A54_11625 [Peptostreptococcaceae bacterium]|nr:hypothetical protein [Peptostreptococcaceae bacterium]
MFFLGNKDDKHIKLAKKILKIKKIPTLIDYEPFKEILKVVNDKEMLNIADEIETLIKSGPKLDLKLNSLSDEKRKLMAKIVLLSQKLNEEENIKAEVELDNTKNEIEKINEQMKDIELTKDELPLKVGELNELLLQIIIKYIYNNLSDDKKNLNYTNKRIEELRIELDNLREKREELDSRIDSMYSFLHGLVGYEEMEKLDKKFLK